MSDAVYSWRSVRPEVSWRTVCLGLALVVLAPLAIYNIQGWFRLLVFPGEANFGEGVLVAEALRLARGESIYTDISKAPHWVATYPPLFQALIAPLAWTGLWWPRLLSLMATGVQLTVFIILLKRLTGSTLAGLVACALWINSPCANAWSAIGRTDTFGRMLMSVSVAYALLAQREQRALWGAVLFSTLAMLVKQNMIAGGIVACWVLFTRSRKAGMIFGVSWVGLTTLSYGLLELASGGRFSDHVFRYTSREVLPDHLRYWLTFFWDTHWPYLLAAPVGIAVATMRRETWWLLVAVAAGLPNAIMAGNPGADRNYFLDLLWGLCLVVPFGLTQISTLQPAVSWRRLGQAASLLIILSIGYSAYLGFTRFKMPYPSGRDRSQARQVTRNLEKMGGPVLSENIGNALLAGYEPDITPYIMKPLTEQQLWDPQPIIENIEAQEYKTILLTKLATHRYPEPVLQAVYENYDLAKVIPHNYLIEEWMDYYIFRPKARER